MGVLSPWFLTGLAAVGLPLYLHLLRKHKTTPLPFSSLMFFERRTQSSIKHRRLRYLLLLAFRLALVILLALAFANPFINRTASQLAGERKMVILAVDDSFSMRAGERMSRARREALGVVSGLRPGDEAQVVALDSQVRVLTPPSPELNQVRSAIESIEAGDARSSYGELARALRSMAESARMPLEVHLFSDMQKTSMPPGFADLQLGPNTRLILHPVAGEAAGNYAVENVSAPRSLYDPKKARVQATISAFGATASRRSVSLAVNGKVIGGKTVEVPENGRATVEFLSPDAPYGFSKGEVRIDSADTLPADDHFLFAMERADPRRVLLLHHARDQRGPLYFRTALNASPVAAFTLETATVEQAAAVDPTRYALVVLSDAGWLSEATETALKKYVQEGGAVWVAAGPSAARRPRLAVFDEPVLESRYSTRSGERFQTVGYVDATHPSIRRADRWEGVKFYQAIHVEPGKARILARLTDGTPLLLEKRAGQGRVLAFASTFDNISNDFPLHPAFVPFVEQTATYLAGVEDRASNLTVDSHLELRAAGDQSAAVELIDPQGKRPLSLKEAATLTSFQVTREGYYEVRRANGRNEMVAVNADRREADLAEVPGETLALWQNTGEGGLRKAAAAESVRQPWSLWWYAVLLVLAAAVGESLVASRYLSEEKETA